MGDAMFEQQQEEEKRQQDAIKEQRRLKKIQFDELKVKVADEAFLKVKKMLQTQDDKRKFEPKQSKQIEPTTPFVREKSSGRVVERSPDQKANTANSSKGAETPV